MGLQARAAPGMGGAGGSIFSADPPLLLDEDERPAMVAIPSDYDPSTSYPLLILFHGITFGLSARPSGRPADLDATDHMRRFFEQHPMP